MAGFCEFQFGGERYQAQGNLFGCHGLSCFLGLDEQRGQNGRDEHAINTTHALMTQPVALKTPHVDTG